MVGDEHSFPFITLLDANIVVPLLAINFGEEFCSLYFGYKLQY